MKAVKLDARTPKELLESDPTLDSIVMQACRFDKQASESFGWENIFPEMGRLPFLKKLRISECGLDRRAVASLAQHLRQIIELDVRK